MSPLETLAKALFEDFSMRETGRQANWNYLSKPRKIEWMKDVLRIHKHLSDRLIKTIKPMGNTSQVNTSWGMGFNEGLRSERIHFITIVQNLHQDLESDLGDFQEKK